MLLSEPYEYLELSNGDSIVLAITGFDIGQATIHPKSPTARHIRAYMDERGQAEPPSPGTPVTVTIPVLRLYATRLDKSSPIAYYDVSAKTLQADLLPRLVAAGNYPAGSFTMNQAMGASIVHADLAAPFAVKLTAAGVRPHKRYSIDVEAQP